MRPFTLAAVAFLVAVLLAPLARGQTLPAAQHEAPAQTVALSLQELDFLIQQAADTPARFSFLSLQLLLAKRQQATTPPAPPPASAPEPKAP